MREPHPANQLTTLSRKESEFLRLLRVRAVEVSVGEDADKATYHVIVDFMGQIKSGDPSGNLYRHLRDKIPVALLWKGKAGSWWLIFENYATLSNFLQRHDRGNLMRQIEKALIAKVLEESGSLLKAARVLRTTEVTLQKKLR